MRVEEPVSGNVARTTLISGAAVYLLLASEWLFQVTKPSMFTLVGWPQKVAILLTAALLASIPIAIVVALIELAGGLVLGRGNRRAAALALVVPAFVLAGCAFLLFENFTKTVLGFNIGSFTSPVRYLYAAGGLLLLFWIHRSLRRRAATPRSGRNRASALGALVLVALSAVAAGLRYEPRQEISGLVDRAGGELPNILILSTDGLDAAHMSVYGYGRPTTPFIASLADELLISENHFSNAAFTIPSIGALLSGKLPLSTGVLGEGGTFRGEHVFQHLPGVLRQLGYYNVDISARYYGDAYDMNVRQGFHVANGRSLRNETLPILGWMGKAYPSELYFVSLTLERLRQRLLHAFGIADMTDFFDVVAKRFTPWATDQPRIRLLEHELAEAPRPYFAHVHLLDTHRRPGTRKRPTPIERHFHVRKPRFSNRAEPEARDFYDDAIAGYDDWVEHVVGLIDAAGELDRTVLILNSDHGKLRQPVDRLPLLIRFPHAAKAGRIIANTQRVDLPPTILDYLGVEPPEWMAGRSLLRGELDPRRTILVAGQKRQRTVRWLALLQCQRAYMFYTGRVVLELHSVPGHTAPCSADGLLGEDDARRRLFAELETEGRLPVPLASQLASLQIDNNPVLRQWARDAIRSGTVPTLRLGETFTLAQVYPDFWTAGTEPAAILLRNDWERPRRFELVVGSGQQHRFPVRFTVQDDQRMREFVFSAPGFQTVDLGEVEPGDERLFVIHSESSWTAERLDRELGVRLLVTGSWLNGLLGDQRPEIWQQAAELILERRVPTAALAEDWLVANVHNDLWTRGSEPAGLALRNDGSQPLTARIEIQSGRGHSFPLRVRLTDGTDSRELLFEGPGSMVVELPQVPPGSAKLFIVRSDGGWVPATRAKRELGVRLSPG